MFSANNLVDSKLIGLKDYFEADYLSIKDSFRERLENQQVILIGAAGSIGYAMVPLVLDVAPKNLLLMDQDENRLTTLLRLVRAKDWVHSKTQLAIAAMDFGSVEAKSLISNFSSNPIILNFAAAKHVRSERDKYGIAHLLSENFLKPWQLIEDTNPKYYFGVSTDKAANPVNFMGVSKALHEQILFLTNGSSARFANVAFSQGSLLDSWRYRLSWNEPLVVPQDIERFLITHEDAARLCAISIGKADRSSVVVPNSGVVESRPLAKVALDFLAGKNLNPKIYDDYLQAKTFLEAEGAESGSWPVVSTNSDTPGEKKFEEFIGKSEKSKKVTNLTSQVSPQKTTTASLTSITEYLRIDFIDNLESGLEILTDLIKKAIPTFEPIFGNEKLDDRP